MSLLRVILLLVVVVAAALVLVRVVMPYLRRTGAVRTVVPGSVVEYEEPLPGTLPLARDHGYDTADVDRLLDRVYALAGTVSGRIEALELIRSARFHLDRAGGYEPVHVDRHMDALAAALGTGGELPPRPGYR